MKQTPDTPETRAALALLVWAPGWLTSAEAYRDIDDGFISAVGDVALHGVTHWRHLPAGPEVQP